MKTYAVILKNDLAGNLSVPAGSDNYLQIDGRLSLFNVNEIALSHFNKVKPSYKHIVVYNADSIGSKHVRIISILGGGSVDEKTIKSIITKGCYK